MGYIPCWRKIPKTEEDWKKFFFLDKDKLHMEDYECWYYESQHLTVKADEEGNFLFPEEWDKLEETDTVWKDSYKIKGVDKYIHLKILRWHRHPNHWE